MSKRTLTAKKLALCPIVLFLALPFLPGRLTRAEDCQKVMLYQKNGADSLEQFGFFVAGTGDVNGDGKPDFVVGAPGAVVAESGPVGSVFVYSGFDGALLFRHSGEAPFDQLGFSVSGTGDVNGDGKADVIAGAPFSDVGGMGNAGSAYVLSGADGSVLFRKNGPDSTNLLGWSVGGLGDINADGKSDFIIGARLGDPEGRVDAGVAFIYSGANGTLLFQKDGASPGDWFGYSVAGAADVNADGTPDFIVGAFSADNGSRVDAGAAYVYSGLNGNLLFECFGEESFDHMGVSVSGVGDVNNDSKNDFLIAATFTSPGGTGEAGSVYLYSGADGSLLFRKDGENFLDRLGRSVSGGGDVDGDGTVDFVAGAFFADPHGLFNAGSAYVYSGKDGGLIFQIDGSGDGDNLGISVAGLGDVNGDGRSDVIIGARFADPNDVMGAGTVYVSACSIISGKGDLNGDGILNPQDVVLFVNCAFLGSGNCPIAFTDLNCDGSLTASDVVIELNIVFLGQPFPC